MTYKKKEKLEATKGKEKPRVLGPGHIPGAHKKGNILDAGNSAGFRFILKPGE